MNTASVASAGTAPRRSFLYLSMFVLGFVLFGFSFTYWRPLFRGAGFAPLIHVHAALWFGWFALLALQATLVGLGRYAWHRTLGISTVVYTSGLVALSLFLALRAIGRDADLAAGGPEAVGTIIPLSQIVMFSVFFTTAILRRRQPETHKRLLILAALVGSTPTFARISIGLLGAPNVPLIFTASNLLLGAVVLADWRTSRQFHSAYLWGGLVVVTVRALRVPLAMSPAWTWFANQLAHL